MQSIHLTYLISCIGAGVALGFVPAAHDDILKVALSIESTLYALVAIAAGRFLWEEA